MSLVAEWSLIEPVLAEVDLLEEMSLGFQSYSAGDCVVSTQYKHPGFENAESPILGASVLNCCILDKIILFLHQDSNICQL